MNPNNTQNNSPEKIVTRFAPSPTGLFHVGSLRTALFNYLFARKNNGIFILRIEDTDKERSKPEYEKGILDSMAWLGLNYDTFFRQSENVAEHSLVLKRLVAEDKAYVSEESSGTSSSVIRFRNPGKAVTFNDLILGEITVDTSDLGDFIIAKDFETPLYNFVVVVDDHAEGVTHVIRGQDHISNTPRQILIYQALGFAVPNFAHIPLILDTQKAKLSKRKHGESVAVDTYEREGYLPSALLNFMAMIGWNSGTEQEIFSLAELVKTFELSRVQRGGAVFNIEKLKWVNKEHIRLLPLDEQEILTESALPEFIKELPQWSEERLKKVVPIILERISNFGEIVNFAKEGEYSYFFSQPEYKQKDFLWKKEISPENIQKVIKHLQKTIDLLTGILDQTDTFNYEAIKSAVWTYAEAEGKGDVLWPMRYALSGRVKSPDPFALANVFGKSETLSRINTAIEFLNA